jgi:hypothetical protein
MRTAERAPRHRPAVPVTTALRPVLGVSRDDEPVARSAPTHLWRSRSRSRAQLPRREAVPAADAAAEPSDAGVTVRASERVRLADIACRRRPSVGELLRALRPRESGVRWPRDHRRRGATRSDVVRGSTRGCARRLRRASLPARRVAAPSCAASQRPRLSTLRGRRLSPSGARYMFRARRRQLFCGEPCRGHGTGLSGMTGKQSNMRNVKGPSLPRERQCRCPAGAVLTSVGYSSAGGHAHCWRLRHITACARRPKRWTRCTLRLLLLHAEARVATLRSTAHRADERRAVADAPQTAVASEPRRLSGPCAATAPVPRSPRAAR